ncbi:MAG: ABC transporter permease subunit, partial [Planctomycetaceae bacterium]|nr:ABC transporter permease subunit [Planctomycetaceae bacterium]
MQEQTENKTAPAEEQKPVKKSPSFWVETWQRFKGRKMAMMALIYIGFLCFVAIFAPAIAGTKPVICKYKGHIYFPAMGYFRRQWENPIFFTDHFRNRYPENLKQKDPDSWAIWPLVYQDPYRRVYDDEWKGLPGNPTQDNGAPSLRNWFGTDQRGVDVFAQMVHGTTIALLVGFVSMGIAGVIGILIGALAGFYGKWIDMGLSRLIEVVMCIPTLILILAIIAIIESPTIWHMMAIIGLTGWTGIARLARAEFMRLRESDFVLAAKTTGVGQFRIIFRYILPNSL